MYCITRSFHIGQANFSVGPQGRTYHRRQGQLRFVLFWLFLLGLGVLLVCTVNEAGAGAGHGGGGPNAVSAPASANDRERASGGFGAVAISSFSGPCHPLANGAANPADHDPSCQPADPQQCPHPPTSGAVPAACLPVYEAALKAPPSPSIAGMACHPLPDGEANPYDPDPACQPADPGCVRISVGPPAPGCLPAYLYSLQQPPLKGTDCHPLPNREANPADPDPACRPADPAHCHRLPMNEIGPFAPACGFASVGPLPGLSSSPGTDQPTANTVSPPAVQTGNPFADGIWGGLEQMVADCWTQVLDWLGSFTFVLQTPGALSYEHWVVVAGYRWSLALLGGLTSLALVAAGYQLMIGVRREGSVAWAEQMWSLVLALVLAFFGLALVKQAVELCNLASRALLIIFGGSAAGTLGFQDLWSGIRTVTAPLAWILFAIVALIILLLLSITRLVQIALLDLLIALMPIWLLMMATPGLRPYGRLASTLLFEVLLCQVAQDATLAMGAALVAGIGHATATPISLLVGLAGCYLALRVPAILSRTVQAAQGSLPGLGEQVVALAALFL